MYWQPVYQMVENTYCHLPHFDLKCWTLDNIDIKNAIGGLIDVYS